MRIRLNKIDGFITNHNGVRCLVLFDCWWFDKICNRIKYLIIHKNGIKNSIKHNFGKIIIDSFSYLPIEKKY